MTDQSKKRGRRDRKGFSEEFKREAVALYRNTQATLAEASQELGISETTLSRWQQELAASEAAAEQPSYQELVQTIRRLETENDFLKKTSSYFASRQPTGMRCSKLTWSVIRWPGCVGCLM